MENKKQIKKVHTGHFAECYTRQRGSLPSVWVITLGKEHRPGHRLRFFAECYVTGTRQRGRLCRVPIGTLGKEPDMGTLPGGLFAECCQEDTRQRYLRCRVSPLTLGKAAVSVTRRRNGRFSLPSARSPTPAEYPLRGRGLLDFRPRRLVEFIRCDFPALCVRRLWWKQADHERSPQRAHRNPSRQRLNGSPIRSGMTRKKASEPVLRGFFV